MSTQLADIQKAADFHSACSLLLRIHQAEETDSLDTAIRDFLKEHGYLEN